jgi:hypothetical protein
MAELKIARFIGIDACKSVFSDDSTFVVRSPVYYRRLYETTAGADNKGDRNEGTAETTGGGSADFTDFLVSCWMRLEGSEPTRREWDIFEKDEQNVVAIVTTPGLVAEFLNKALRLDTNPAKRGFPFLSLAHGEVSDKKQDINYTNISDVVPFFKSWGFEQQQEYRFVVKYAKPPVIDSLIFCAGRGYMEHRNDGRLCNFANPQMSRENKEELLKALLTAGASYGDFADSRTYEFPSPHFTDDVRKQICEIMANGEILFE